MGKVKRKIQRFSLYSFFDFKRRNTRIIMTVIIATALYIMLAPTPAASTNFDRQQWLSAKHNHTPNTLSDPRVLELAKRNDVNYMWSKYLKPILVPRIVGTENHRLVREHIINSLSELSTRWHLETDQFVDRAPRPYGEVEFTSVIATVNPSAPRKLVIACHYESKIMSDGVFLAATDSAVPCAMMLNLAAVLDAELARSAAWAEVSLQLVFLDGEEAFVEWTNQDSIYGARHLAQKWENTPYPDASSPNSVLDSIDLFVLLDLLGSKDPKFESHFGNTAANHRHMQSVEQRLHSHKQLEQHKQPNSYFVNSQRYAGRISDDHLPFLHRGVRVLHWISTPFPRVWHTLDDNEQNLHRPTVANLSKLLTVFVAEYLHL